MIDHHAHSQDNLELDAYHAEAPSCAVVARVCHGSVGAPGPRQLLSCGRLRPGGGDCVLRPGSGLTSSIRGDTIRSALVQFCGLLRNSLAEFDGSSMPAPDGQNTGSQENAPDSGTHQRSWRSEGHSANVAAILAVAWKTTTHDHRGWRIIEALRLLTEGEEGEAAGRQRSIIRVWAVVSSSRRAAVRRSVGGAAELDRFRKQLGVLRTGRLVWWRPWLTQCERSHKRRDDVRGMDRHSVTPAEGRTSMSLILRL